MFGILIISQLLSLKTIKDTLCAKITQSTKKCQQCSGISLQIGVQADTKKEIFRGRTDSLRARSNTESSFLASPGGGGRRRKDSLWTKMSFLRLENSVDDDLKARPHFLPTWDDLVLWQDKSMRAGITQFCGKCKPSAQNTLVPVVRSSSSGVKVS